MSGTDRNVALIHSPGIEAYRYPPECPFTTQRAAMMRKIIADMGLLTGPGRCEVAPTPAPREILEKFPVDLKFISEEKGRFYPSPTGIAVIDSPQGI